MQKLLKPASIAFYFLILFVFFFVGMYVAGMLGAGKNQMLAGGAIVLGWGVMFAGLAFVASFFIARFTPHHIIVRLNWILLALLILAYGITHYRYLERQKEKEKSDSFEKRESTRALPEVSVSMVSYAMAANKNAIASDVEEAQNQTPHMGIGFFKPNIYEHSTLYFYGDVNLEKGMLEHMPMDSVVFANDKYGNPTTTYAPPWLFPEHLKLDYGIITFKALGIGYDFVKVEVNKVTHQWNYLDKQQGEFLSWQEFLMGVNSVEFIDKSNQSVHVKPLNYAGEVNVAFDFMLPLLIEQEWMYVRLVNDSLVEQGKGWIQWKKDNLLLITYSLLS